MPDKRRRKHTSKHSKGKQSGQIERDPQVDLERFEELASPVYQRDDLERQFNDAVRQLAARRRGIDAATGLYESMLTMDFRMIQGSSNSGVEAQKRRGTHGKEWKNEQEEEVDMLTQNYQSLSIAKNTQETVSIIPRSVDEFAMEEQEMVRDIARI